MTRNWILTLTLCGCVGLVFGCGGLEEPEPATTQSSAAAKADKPCAIRCAEGYELTPACTCKEIRPSRCSGALVLCIQGTFWDEKRCKCVAGDACGPTVCPVGKCCNASCGTCGDVCTQQVCAPAPL